MLKIDSKIQKISKFSKTSKRFQLLPNASECIPNGAEHVLKPRKTHETFEKLRDNFHKNFFHGPV